MAKTINATHYEEIPIFHNEDDRDACLVNAIIETPRGSRHKYALKPEYGIIAFRELMPLADDGDPLDIAVITEAGLITGCMIQARVLGALRLKKDDVENDRLIAVPLPSEGAPLPSDTWRELADVPPDLLHHVTSFLVEYSRRQGRRIDDEGTRDARKAMKLVRKAAKIPKRRGVKRARVARAPRDTLHRRPSRASGTRSLSSRG